MTIPPAPSWRAIAVWAVAGVLLWFAGDGLKPRTTLDVFSDGGRIQVSAAGSSLSAPVAVERVERIEIRATDSIEPPGGATLTVRQGPAVLAAEKLPRRFVFPPAQVDPVGDWELDDLAGSGLVWQSDLEAVGAFELTAAFTGRPHQHLAVTLVGIPTITVSFRRGLINNDLFLWDDQWRALAVTSIDPRPAEHLSGVAATLARAAGAGCLLIAAFLALARITGTGLDAAGPVTIRGAGAVAGLLGIVALGASLRVSDTILDRLPHTPDSTVYLLQAEWLTHGELSREASPIQDHLDVPFTYVNRGRWVSHYPPGWSLMLAGGLLAGAQWAVAPILGGLYVVLLWRLGRDLAGDAVGLAAAALATLSPMSRIIFSSHLSHAGSAVLVAAHLTLVVVARRRSSLRWAAAAGLVLGLCFGVRPLVAIAAGVPVAIMLLGDFRRRPNGGAARLLTAAACGGIVGATPALLCNAAITGNPMSFPYTLARGSMYGLENVPFGLQNLDAIVAASMPALHGWGWLLSRSDVYLALPLAFACIPFLRRRASREDFLLLGFIVCLLAVHLPTRAHGLHGFGPRYAFDGFVALFVLSGRGFQELSRTGPAVLGVAGGTRSTGRLVTASAAILLFAALAMPAAAVLPDRLRHYAGYNGVNDSLERAVDALELTRAVVLFEADDWRNWAMASRMMVEGTHQGLVFARSLHDNSALWEAYPDLPVYGWREGRLEEVTGERK